MLLGLGGDVIQRDLDCKYLFFVWQLFGATKIDYAMS